MDFVEIIKNYRNNKSLLYVIIQGNFREDIFIILIRDEQSCFQADFNSVFTSNMYGNKLLLCAILIQFVTKKLNLVESKVFYRKAEMRTNPANMNSSQITFRYTTVGSTKYIEAIEPFTVFFFRELKYFMVC